MTDRLPFNPFLLTTMVPLLLYWNTLYLEMSGNSATLAAVSLLILMTATWVAVKPS